MKAEGAERDAQKIRAGRELTALWMGLFRSLRLYDWRHAGVKSFAARLKELIARVAETSGVVDLTVRADSLYLDGVRIREGGTSAASYHALVQLLGSVGVGSLQVDADVEPRELQLVGHLLLAVSDGHRSTEDMLAELKLQGATNVEVILRGSEPDLPREVDAAEMQRRIYVNSIGVLKSVFHEAHAKNRINSRRVKRVVQQMIESFEDESQCLVNLTSVKNYDEYTFNHSVNVGVLSIALGRAVGLSRHQLYLMGQAGMLHDLGKLCIPRAVLNKPGRLTPEERRQVQAHPEEGFFSIATKQGVSSDSIAVALGAYEHHLNLDGTGYPQSAARRRLGLLSRIVAIVDRYDAMTSARVYRSAPIPPPKALAILYQTQASQVDQVLLRYFMNLLGAYPLGTVVRLSDNRVGIVVGAPSDAALRHFPIVRPVLDEHGHAGEGEPIDLSATAKDPEPIQVIEALNAGDYGIEPMDYIL